MVKVSLTFLITSELLRERLGSAGHARRTIGLSVVIRLVVACGNLGSRVFVQGRFSLGIAIDRTRDHVALLIKRLRSLSHIELPISHRVNLGERCDLKATAHAFASLSEHFTAELRALTFSPACTTSVPTGLGVVVSIVVSRRRVQVDLQL